MANAADLRDKEERQLISSGLPPSPINKWASKAAQSTDKMAKEMGCISRARHDAVVHRLEQANQRKQEAIDEFRDDARDCMEMYVSASKANVDFAKANADLTKHLDVAARLLEKLAYQPAWNKACIFTLVLIALFELGAIVSLLIWR